MRPQNKMTYTVPKLIFILQRHSGLLRKVKEIKQSSFFLSFGLCLLQPIAHTDHGLWVPLTETCNRYNVGKKKKRGGREVYLFLLRPWTKTCSHLFCLYTVGENPLTWPHQVHGGLYVTGLDVQQCAKIQSMLLYMNKQAWRGGN